jgi:hypothetical protein
MDNLARYGFRFCKGRSAPHLVPEKKKVASAYQASTGVVNVPLRIGDPVQLVSTGTVALLVVGSGVPYGVVVGIQPYWDGTKMVFGDRLPGATTPGTTVVDRFSYVMVMPFLGAVFEVDCDDATTFTTLAAYQDAIGENADISYSGIVSVGAFPKLDISTNNTTNTLQMRILGISDTAENQDYAGANVKVYVTANLTSEAPILTTGT